MAAEGRLSVFNFSEKKVRAHLDLCLREGILQVVDLGHSIGGGVAGILSAPWYSDDKIAVEFGIYLREDLRGSTYAPRLVNSFARWAKNAGAREAILAITTGVLVSETEDLYNALGFETIGPICVRRF